MEKMKKQMKALMLLQVLFGIVSVIMAFAYLKGEFRNMAVFVVPFVLFAALYIATQVIRKKIEAAEEKAKEEAKKAAESEEEP